MAIEEVTLPECGLSELRPENEAVLRMFHEPAAGLTLEDVCRPGYWKSHAWKLKRYPNVFIQCVAKDNKWMAELYVVSVGEDYAKVRVISEWTEKAKPGRKATAPDGWEIDHVSNGWRARDPNGEIRIREQATEDDAIAAAKALVKELAA